MMRSLPTTESESQNAIAEIRTELRLAKAEAPNLARESLSALPCIDETLSLYVGAHVETQPSTLARRMAAVRLMHRWSGYKSPFELAPNFTAVYTGYKRRWAYRRSSNSPQSAATEVIVRMLIDDQRTDTLIGLWNCTLLLVGFDAALRRSELVGVDVEHLTPHRAELALNLPS